MDPIMEIARKHNIKVIEDVSHAQGALYKGRHGRRDRRCRRGVAVCRASRWRSARRECSRPTTSKSTSAPPHSASTSATARTRSRPSTSRPGPGLPLGGYKYRMHQISSAVGRVQLKYYPERIIEIQKAMNYFWDLLEGVPGIRAHRPDKGSGSTMGGWYAAHGHLRSRGARRALSDAVLRGRPRRGLHGVARLQLGPAPASAAQHLRCLRPRQTDPHRELRPRRPPARGQPAHQRGHRQARLSHPVVQALPARGHRAIRERVQEGLGQLPRASRRRPRQSRTPRRLALLPAHALAGDALGSIRAVLFGSSKSRTPLALSSEARAYRRADYGEIG